MQIKSFNVHKTINMFNNEKYQSCKVQNKDKFLGKKDDYVWNRIDKINIHLCMLSQKVVNVNLEYQLMSNLNFNNN